MINENVVNIDVTLGNERIISKELILSYPQLDINDDFVRSIIRGDENLDCARVKYCMIKLGVDNIAVNIDQYTLTDTVYISGFYNRPSSIRIFKAHNTNINITDQRIDRLQVDCQTIVLGKCQIEQIDIGMVENQAAIMRLTIERDKSLPTAYNMKSIDLRDCEISKISAYVECDAINIQRCEINSFKLIGGFGSQVQSTIKSLKIWQNAEINTLEIHCKLSYFEIKESNITTISAKGKCFLDEIIVNDSLITSTHHFEKKHFLAPNLVEWILISKSATNARDYGARSEANYQIACRINKGEKGLNRIVNLFFSTCSGYGYKPADSVKRCSQFRGTPPMN